MIKLLTETPAMITGNYAQYWPPVMTALVGLFELPVDDTVPDDEHFIEIEDTPGYQTAYSQLIYAGKREHDPVAGVGDPKAFLAKSLASLSSQQPGRLPSIIGGLQQQPQVFLQQYLQAAGVTLQ